MSELLSSITAVGGGLPQLAPDLTYPADKDATDTIKTISVGVTSGVESTFVSLTGKYAISFLKVDTLNGSCTNITLTIDGVDIWNVNPGTGSSNDLMIGDPSFSESAYMCEETLVLKLTYNTTNTRSLEILARPIL